MDGIAQVGCGLCSADQGGAHAHADAALAGLLLQRGLLTLTRFGDGDGLGIHVDITVQAGGQHLRAGLGVGLARRDVDVTRDTAQRGANDGGAVGALVGALSGVAPQHATGEEARFGFFVEIGLLILGVGGGDGDLAAGSDVEVLVSDDLRARDGGVGATGPGHGLT